MYVKLRNDMIKVPRNFATWVMLLEVVVMFKMQWWLEYMLAGENLVSCLKTMWESSVIAAERLFV